MTSAFEALTLLPYQRCGVVVGVAVGRRTGALQGLNKVSLQDNAGTTLLRGHRSRTTHLISGTDVFSFAESIGRGIVPTLAR